MTDAMHFPQEKVALLQRTVCKGLTEDELQIFLHVCERTQLDPIVRQIYWQKRTNTRTGEQSMTTMTGIDGLRTIAARTGEYAGNDDPLFDNEKEPKKATVTVWRMVNGVRCPFTSSARWDQYFPGEKMGFMWKKMPHLMLGKCAEALALRKAFPSDMAGLYIAEEMEQADKESPKADKPNSAQQVENTVVVDNWREFVLPISKEHKGKKLGDVPTDFLDFLYEKRKDGKSTYKNEALDAALTAYHNEPPFAEDETQEDLPIITVPPNEDDVTLDEINKIMK